MSEETEGKREVITNPAPSYYNEDGTPNIEAIQQLAAGFTPGVGEVKGALTTKSPGSTPGYQLGVAQEQKHRGDYMDYQKQKRLLALQGSMKGKSSGQGGGSGSYNGNVSQLADMASKDDRLAAALAPFMAGGRPGDRLNSWAKKNAVAAAMGQTAFQLPEPRRMQGNNQYAPQGGGISGANPLAGMNMAYGPNPRPNPNAGRMRPPAAPRQRMRPAGGTPLEQYDKLRQLKNMMKQMQGNFTSTREVLGNVAGQPKKFSLESYDPSSFARILSQYL